MGRVQKPFFHLVDNELVLRYYPFDPAQAPAPAAPPETLAVQPAPAPATPLADWLHEHSAFYRFLIPRLVTVTPQWARGLATLGLVQPRQLPKPTPADYIPVAYGVYQQPPAAEWQASFALTEALIGELRRQVQADGATLAIAAMTSPEQVYPERWQQQIAQNSAMQARQWDMEQPNGVIEQIARRAGLPYLDLLPVFRQQAVASRQPLHLSHDGHWTPAGERLAGATIADFLISEGLVPTRTGPAPTP